MAHENTNDIKYEFLPLLKNVHQAFKTIPLIFQTEC